MRIVANVLANWAAFVVGTAITFVLSPFVVHQLGDARYGVWGVLGAVVGYLGLLDLGIRVGVTRYVARHDATGDRKGVNQVLTSALALFATAGVVAAILGTVIAVALPHVVNVPPEQATEAAWAVGIGGVTVAISLVSGAYGGVIAGLQRLTVLNGIDVATEILRAGAVYVDLRAGGGLVDLALIQLGVIVLRGLVYRVASRRLNPHLHPTRDALDWAMCRQLLQFSGFTMVIHLCGVVIFSSQAVVIAAFLPVAHVAWFVIAANVSQAVQRLVGGVSQAIYPLASARQATQGTAAAATLFTRSARLGALVIFPIVITLVIRGRSFIGLWMGPAYSVSSGAVLEVLMLGVAVSVSYAILVSTMGGLNLHRGMVPAFLAEAGVNVALSILLAPALGIYGVAWGTTLPRLIVALGYGPIYARKKVGLSILDYATNAWFRPVAAMVPFAVATMLIERAWPATDLATLFGQVTAALPLAAIGGWFVGLERDERQRLRNAVAELVGARFRAFARSHLG